jgi:photosystem II stability/assembly factor-like uncharacterized protein
MKLFFRIILFVLFLSGYTYPQWYSVENGTTGYISQIKFKDENTGWYTDDAGQIYKTTDGSITWKCIDITYIDSLDNLRPIINSGDTVLISANNGRLLRSVNGGLNWSVIYFNPNYKIIDFSFIRQNLIYAVLDGSRALIKSTNTGINWITIHNFTAYDFPEIINFLNDSIGFGKLHQKIIKTTNRGFDWFVIYNDSGTTVNQFDYMKFVNLNLGFLQKDLYHLFRTTNGGYNWEQTEINSNNIKEIEFENESTGYMIENFPYLKFFKTTNSGINWIQQYTYTSTFKYRQFINFEIKGNIFYINAYCSGSVLKSTNKGYSWTDFSLYNGPTQFNSISFANAQTGFIGAYDLFLLKTTNSGSNWVLDSNFHYNYTWGLGNIKKIQFVNENTGWLLADTGFFKTTNIGANWNYFYTDFYKPNNFFFINSNTGWVIKDTVNQSNNNTYIYKTINGGQNFILQSILDVSWSTDIKFGDSQYGYISLDFMFGSPNLYRTTNGGDIWQGIEVGRITSICIINRNITFVTQEHGSIYKTTDGGNNWYNVCNDNLNWLRIKFYNDKIGFATTYDKNIYYTTNYGENWNFSFLGSKCGLYDLHFPSNGLAFAVGRNGKIFKTDNLGGVIGISNINSQIPNENKLFQNYPNPFNPVTSIKYQIPKSVNSQKSNVKLIIYDILGKEIATLVNEKQTPGIYEVVFNGNNLSAGIYFYSLIINDKRIDTKKLVLLK